MKNNALKKATLLLLAFVMAFAGVSCKDDGPVLSKEAEILSFVFNTLTPPLSATITGTSITATVAYNVNVTALVPTITLSEKATVSPASGVAQNFSSPVTYVVTAEDGTKVTYTVTITVLPPPRLAVTPVWTRNLVQGGLPSWFTANNDRDIAVHGNFVFVHNNNDKIRVISTANGTDQPVGTTNFIDGRQNFAAGNLFLLGMDADSEGRIVAGNLRVGSDARNPWNVYVWNNKDANQEMLFQYPTPAGYRLGDNITVVGNVRGNGIVYAPVAGRNEILKFTIANGTANTTPQIVVLQGLTSLGNAPDVAPVSSAANANMIVAGTGLANIAEYTSAGALVGQLPEALKTGNTAMLFSFALDVAYFEIAGRKVVAATATDFTSNAADAGYLYLIDITDGWNNIRATNIERVAFTPNGNIDRNLNGTGGVDVVVTGNEAVVYAMITNFGVGAYRVRFQ